MNPLDQKQFQEKNIVEAVLQFAQACNYEKKHSQQVTRLALRIFDELHALHKLGLRERVCLQAAGLLHDIGWVKGRMEHHKTARDMILAADLPLGDREKMIAALVARYHRRSFPQDTHKYFSDLPPEDKKVVRQLSSFLRMADGLDRSHLSSVENLSCEIFPEKLILKIQSKSFLPEDQAFGKKKADLFEEVWKRDVVIVPPGNGEE